MKKILWVALAKITYNIHYYGNIFGIPYTNGFLRLVAKINAEACYCVRES